MKRFVIGLVVLVISTGIAMAAASDDATSYTGFANTDTGGSGFGAWSINTPGNSGSFLASGAGNPDCAILTGDNAWGMWADADTVDAIRPFDTELQVGEFFSVSFQNRGVANGGGVGISLRDTTDTAVFELYFNGGDTDYTYNDASAGNDSGIGWANSGFNVTFSLTASDAYSCSVTPVGGGAATTWAGAIDDTNPIDNFRMWNWQANLDSGGDANFYANSMSIAAIPEPTAAIMLIFGALGIFAYRRNRK